TSIRPRLMELIQTEISNQRAGRYARIIAKMNQLEDPELVELLCEASAAGVRVDLIVRGFCCLRPGVPGRTAGIRVRSVIGRFLEHSRVFYFANGHEELVQGEFYIGSADWMYRNLSKRVEVVTPVHSKEAKEKLWEVLEICLRDCRQAWLLHEDGTYSQLTPQPGAEGAALHGTHVELMDLARRRFEAN
ncbi:MAG TPA: hypothetical protein VKG79_01295, partial [Bryobacteraceae bacterium]|nr:hypothetical protein [Bryobacteraceae bacterium]